MEFWEACCVACILILTPTLWWIFVHRENWYRPQDSLAWRAAAAQVLRPDVRYSQLRPLILSLDAVLHGLAHPTHKGAHMTFFPENAFQRKALYTVANYYRLSKSTRFVNAGEEEARYRILILCKD